MRLPSTAVAAFLAAFLASVAAAASLRPGDLVVTRDREPDLPGAILHVDPQTGLRTVIAELRNLESEASGIAIDADGDLLVVERSRPGPRGLPPSQPSEIVRVDPETGAQSVVASFPPIIGQIDVSPFGIAIDASGDLLVTDVGRSTILRIDAATGATEVVSSGGLLAAPTGIAIGAAGDVFVLNWGPLPLFPTIVRIDPESGEQSGLFFEGQEFRAIAIEAGGDLLVTARTPPPPRICVGGSNDGYPCTGRTDCPGGRCPRPAIPGRFSPPGGPRDGRPGRRLRRDPGARGGHRPRCAR